MNNSEIRTELDNLNHQAMMRQSTGHYKQMPWWAEMYEICLEAWEQNKPATDKGYAPIIEDRLEQAKLYYDRGIEKGGEIG